MRSFFLRLRSIIIALFFIVVLTGFLVLPEQMIRLAEEIDGQERNIRALLVAWALLADFILVYIIWQELRVHRGDDEQLIVKSRGASAEITLDSVQNNIEAQLQKLEQVYGVQADVRNERGKVLVDAEVDADENVNVPKKTNEIHREIKKVVERQMGLKLGDKPQIRFRLMSQPAVLSSPATNAYETPPLAAPIQPKKSPARNKETGGGGFGRFLGRPAQPEKPGLANPDSRTARPSPPMPEPPTPNFFDADPYEGHITDKIQPRPLSGPRVIPLANDSDADEEDNDS